MILEKHPLTLAEVGEMTKNLEEKQTLKDYLKKFKNLTKSKADELKKEIQNLNNVKIKEEYIVKLIDFLPTEKEDVNKIFSDVTLSDEETTQIIDIIKKYA